MAGEREDTMTIYIARHGQNEDNANGVLNGHRDLPLTGKGREQAVELADGVKQLNLGIKTVVSSPLIRARTTAEIVAKKLQLDVHVEQMLIERDFGVMTGKPVVDVEKLCAPKIVKAENITYFLEPAGGETFPNLIGRAYEFLTLARRKYEEPALFVTHGDIGKMLYAAYYDLPWMHLLTQFHFGNCDLLELSPSSRHDQSHVIHIPQHNA